MNKNTKIVSVYIGVLFIFLSLILNEWTLFHTLERTVPFSVRGKAVIWGLQVFSFGLGTGMCFSGRNMTILSRTIATNTVTFAFIALYLPLLALIGAEIVLAFAVPRVQILSALTRMYDLRAYEDRKLIAAAMDDSGSWRREGVDHSREIPLYRPLDIPGFHINSDGVRTREFNEKNPDAEKVALLGGSSVWGSHVTDDHTVAAYLERLLNRSSGDEYEVYNLGVEGYGINLETKILKLFNKKLNFHYAIFYHGGNDFIKTDKKVMDAPGGVVRVIRVPKAFNHFEVFRLFEALVLRLRRLVGLDPRPNFSDAISKQVIAERVTWYGENYEAARAYCRAHGIKCYFLLQPLIFNRLRTFAWEKAIVTNHELLHPGRSRAYNLVIDGIMALGLDGVFDVRSVFDGLERPVFGDLIHPNKHGNREVAKRLFRLAFDAQLETR